VAGVGALTASLVWRIDVKDTEVAIVVSEVPQLRTLHSPELKASSVPPAMIRDAMQPSEELIVFVAAP